MRLNQRKPIHLLLATAYTVNQLNIFLTGKSPDDIKLCFWHNT